MKGNVVLAALAACVIFALVWFAWLHRASIAVLSPAGTIALQERDVLIATVALSALIVIPVFIMLFSFAWSFRAGGPEAHKRHNPNWDHTSWWTTEYMWWLPPASIVFILAVIAWQTSHSLDPYKPIISSNGSAPVTVEVIALDWKWLFIYPQQGIATVNFLEIPAQTPVHFMITADAPMNSFWIPSLGGQIMAMAGMTNQLYLEADKTGTFNGLSANISGEGFSGMTFQVKAVSQNDFAGWVNGVQHNPAALPLTQNEYTQLAKPSENVPPLSFSSIDPNVYTASVMHYMMPQMTATSSMPAMQGMSGMSDT
jgi:cytochrome o ubiquinol oxidase subunit 2